MSDYDQFPDPTYARKVLAPLFEGAKRFHADAFDAIDRAHLVMLAETDILAPEDAGRIAVALEEIRQDRDLDKMRYTGEFEDYFFVVENELKRRLGPDLGGRLHTARSRNDIDHTIFKMALRGRIDALLAQMHNLAEVMLRTAQRERDTLIVAYTHGQPAQPSTFGHYLSAALEILLRDMRRLEAARDTVDLCSMGAAAITTSGFPIDRHLVARLLGFAGPQQNSYSCIAAVDYITATYAALELPMLHLGRLIQDLQFWSAFEVGQIHVPDAFVQISSIMPQKRNPVPIEHLRHLASQAASRARAQISIIHNTPFTDMNDSEGETQEAGYAAFDVAERVLSLLAALIPSLRINEDRVAATTSRACITITELADTLVRDEGLSFRTAHDIAAATARAVVAGGKGLSEGFAPFSDAFKSIVGRPPALSPAAFTAAVSARNFVDRRNRFGGPAAAALNAAFGDYSAELDDIGSRMIVRKATADNSAAALADRFDRLKELG
ncbi:argininosuccinate lyase [Paracoccus sediminicola]|uniref:argininosuccinate lyase n=1 Tax=Paracoccus sediminicola TaxID=3017783 RepID=UPI0022F04CB6|nr:argininosuccinate lyase [Paracoccus sediminicola]WBU56253.1 argininosuccinate lyase [Paracoccus sediminicola]